MHSCALARFYGFNLLPSIHSTLQRFLHAEKGVLVEDLIKSQALAFGFALCGVSRVPEDGLSPRADQFMAWLIGNFHGPLGYLQHNTEIRANIRTRLPWAKTILSVASFYDSEACGTPGVHLAAHVARYARGRDYHLIFKRRLKEFGRKLEREEVCGKARSYCDTGPMLERAWAENSGVGWIGKNGCVIHPRLGSYMLLGELVLDIVLEPDAPASNHCGTCRRCLDACPTQAIVAPGILDAARCISTGTIERCSDWPEKFWDAQGAWAAGCDICQEVCPFNGPSRSPAPDAELARPLPWQEMLLADAITMDETGFLALFPASALRRTGCKGIRLGAITVAGNLRVETCRSALEKSTNDPDVEIQARARWALDKLTRATSSDAPRELSPH
jgi:epoxyqueuosine reductase